MAKVISLIIWLEVHPGAVLESGLRQKIRKRKIWCIKDVHLLKVVLSEKMRN